MNELDIAIKNIQDEICALRFQNIPLDTIPTDLIENYINLVKRKECVHSERDFDENIIKKYKYLSELSQIRNKRFFQSLE